jgi:hypothetical protein
MWSFSYGSQASYTSLKLLKINDMITLLNFCSVQVSFGSVTRSAHNYFIFNDI